MVGENEMLAKAGLGELAVLAKSFKLVVLATAVSLFEVVGRTPLAMFEPIELNDELSADALLLLALIEEGILLAAKLSRVG